MPAAALAALGHPGRGRRRPPRTSCSAHLRRPRGAAGAGQLRAPRRRLRAARRAARWSPAPTCGCWPPAANRWPPAARSSTPIDPLPVPAGGRRRGRADRQRRRPALPRPGPRRPARLRRPRRGGRRGRRRDLPAPGRDAAGHRAGRRPGGSAAGRRARRPDGRPLHAADHRSPHRGDPAAHPAGHRRLELPAAHRPGAGAAAATVGVPRQLDPGGDAGRRRMAAAGPAGGRGSARPAGRPVAGRGRPRRADRASGPRYHLLETIRQYAAERLAEAGETDAVARAHAGYLTALAEQAEAELRGDGQARWLPRLAAERDDIDAALAWCTAHATEEPDAGLRLVAPLGWYWYFATDPDGGRRVAAMLAAAPGGSPEARARALQALAVAARPGACIVHPNPACAAAAAAEPGPVRRARRRVPRRAVGHPARRRGHRQRRPGRGLHGPGRGGTGVHPGRRRLVRGAGRLRPAGAARRHRRPGRGHRGRSPGLVDLPGAGRPVGCVGHPVPPGHGPAPRRPPRAGPGDVRGGTRQRPRRRPGQHRPVRPRRRRARHPAARRRRPGRAAVRRVPRGRPPARRRRQPAGRGRRGAAGPRARRPRPPPGSASPSRSSCWPG